MPRQRRSPGSAGRGRTCSTDRISQRPSRCTQVRFRRRPCLGWEGGRPLDHCPAHTDTAELSVRLHPAAPSRDEKEALQSVWGNLKVLLELLRARSGPQVGGGGAARRTASGCNACAGSFRLQFMPGSR